MCELMVEPVSSETMQIIVVLTLRLVFQVSQSVHLLRQVIGVPLTHTK